MTASKGTSASRTLLSLLLGSALLLSGCTAAAVPGQNVTRKTAQAMSQTAEYIQNRNSTDADNNNDNNNVHNNDDKENEDSTVNTDSSAQQSTQAEDEIEAQLKAIETEAAAAPSSADQAPALQPVKTGAEPQPSAPAPASQPAAAAQAAAPVTQSASEPAPADDGIWHIQYVNSRDALSAPDDGSIGIWADGWFIAHSHMANGDKIATFPPRVEVDGKTYHFADKWIAPDEITPDEIVRIRSHEGIVFQTCITDTTNWMVYYEPDGAGYGYQFAHFPYTVNDTHSLGYYPEDYETPAQQAGTPAVQVSQPVEEGFVSFEE